MRQGSARSGLAIQQAPATPFTCLQDHTSLFSIQRHNPEVVGGSRLQISGIAFIGGVVYPHGVAPREPRCVIAVDEAEVTGRPPSPPPERRGPAGDPGLGHGEVTSGRLAQSGLQRNQRQQLKPAARAARGRFPPRRRRAALAPSLSASRGAPRRENARGGGGWQRSPSCSFPRAAGEKSGFFFFFAFDSLAGGSEEDLASQET